MNSILNEQRNSVRERVTFERKNSEEKKKKLYLKRMEEIGLTPGRDLSIWLDESSQRVQTE
jgi:hypothetical protein